MLHTELAPNLYLSDWTGTGREQGLSHTQPNHHTAHACSLEQENSTGCTEQGRQRHKPPGKNTALFDLTSPARAPSLPQGLGTDMDSPALVPVLQGGLASTAAASPEGPQDEHPAQGKAPERFVPAHGGHIHLQADKGQNLLGLHLKHQDNDLWDGTVSAQLPAPAPGSTDPSAHHTARREAAAQTQLFAPLHKHSCASRKPSVK